MNFRKQLTGLGTLTLAAALLPMVAVGCGKGDKADKGGENLTAMTGEMESDTLADKVGGNWQVVLNPDQVDAGASPITVPLVLNIGAMTGNTTKGAKLTGTLSGEPLSDGRLTSGPDGVALEFTAGGFTVDGPVQIRVPEDVQWSAQLTEDGSLAGVVVDDAGRLPKWDAVKQ